MERGNARVWKWEKNRVEKGLTKSPDPPANADEKGHGQCYLGSSSLSSVDDVGTCSLASHQGYLGNWSETRRPAGVGLRSATDRSIDALNRVRFAMLEPSNAASSFYDVQLHSL